MTRQISAFGAGEDRLAVWLEDNCLVIAICDGAGGIPGGARAADLATAGLIRALPGDPVSILERLDVRLAEDPLAGECTAVAVCITDEGVSGASCGDSSAFLDGLDLTIGQARKRRLGGGDVRPCAFAGDGRRLLVCTDGLSGYVRGEALSAALGDPVLRRAADALVQAARLSSGELMDDLALVLVDFESTASGHSHAV